MQTYNYDPILTILRNTVTSNKELSIALGVRSDESSLYRFRHWEDLEDSSKLSLQWKDRKMKGSTRGLSIEKKKLKPIQDFYGVEKKKDPRDLSEQTVFQKSKLKGKDIYSIREAESVLLFEREAIFDMNFEDGGMVIFIFEWMLYQYPEINADYENYRKKANRTELTLIDETILKVFSKISSFLKQSSAYTGLALYNSAYNHVLLEYTYKKVYAKSKKLSENVRNLLTCLRAIFQKCDVKSAEMLRQDSGMWKYVKLTDMDIPNSPKENPKFVFADLFAGIGSFRKALERSKGKCVFTNEILEQSMYTYSENFNIEPGDLNLDYIESFVYQSKMDKIPPINCLVAGFPCKSFSRLGQQSRRGSGKIALALSDPAFGFLVFDTMKIIKERQPEFFILENVPEFVTDKDIWDNTILKAMTDPSFKAEDIKDAQGNKLPKGQGFYQEIGKNDKGEPIEEYVVGLEDIKSRFINLDGKYDVYVRVLNSAGYSSQSRSRCFIIGIRKSLNVDFDYGLLPYVRTTRDRKVIDSKMRQFDSKAASNYENKSNEYYEYFQTLDMHSSIEKAEIPYTLPLGEDDEHSVVNPKYNLSLKQEVHNLYKILIRQNPNSISSSFKKTKSKTQDETDSDTSSGWIAISTVNASKDLQQTILSKATGMTGYGTQQVEIVDENGQNQFATLVAKCNEHKNVYYTCPLSNEKVYRNITPREAVRLMTFDREPSARMYLPIADTGAYTLAGYSIVTKLIEEIALYVVANVLYNTESKN